MGFRDPQHVRRAHSRLQLPNWSTALLMILFIGGVMGLGYFTFTQVKHFVTNLPGGAEPENPGFGEEGSLPDDPDGEGENVDLASWSEGRVTVLLLGIDERQLEHGPWRTDTVILLTVDPVTNRAGMLSLPRDLWVEIPDYGVFDRINTAHFRGDADSYPGGGGPALAMKTVQHNFGVEVNYFASINFYAFVQVVDRLGCIPMHVPETIDDPNYPAAEGSGYDPFHIDAGDYCMGGETLLKYARTRATVGSDFDRAARQQQVILSIRDHVLDTGQLPTLLAQSSAIYGDVQSGVNTNLSLEQMVRLTEMAAEIPEDNICTAVISGDYVEDLATMEDGSQVIIWDREKVRGLIGDIFSGTGVCSPGSEDLAAAARAEGAAISVVNGTNQEGLATETGDRLTAAGLSVVSVGNADRFDYPQTTIYNYTGKQATARYLAQVLGVPESSIVNAEPTTALYDIQVILGADYLE